MDAHGGFAGLGSSLAAEARGECRSAALAATLLLPDVSMPTDSPLDSEGEGSEAKREASRLLDHALATVS